MDAEKELSECCGHFETVKDAETIRVTNRSKQTLENCRERWAALNHERGDVARKSKELHPVLTCTDSYHRKCYQRLCDTTRYVHDSFD